MVKTVSRSFFLVVLAFVAFNVANPKLVSYASANSVDIPVHIRDVAIGLDASIVGVGLNEKGEMAVPSGESNNVGWYESGTVPGNYGSAVFDAHVFAAFSQLQYAKAD